jgi:uncharacterized phiE125 gp8 family phage protein
MMSMQLIAEPANEPVTLDEAKLFLRIDTTDDDALLASLVAASRRLIEQTTRNCLLSQSWRFGVDRWPSTMLLRLPLAPLLSLTSVTVLDAAGNRIAQNLSDFIINATSVPPTVRTKAEPLASGACEGGIQVEAVFGYGNTAASVPQPLRTAVLMVVAHYYETRGLGDGTLPAAVRTLIAPFVRRAL